MDVQNSSLTKTQSVLWLILLAYLLFLYGPGLYETSLSSDLAILISFAGRIADGMKPLEAYFDPNPPMSMLIYLPVVWISRLFEFELYRVHFFYSVSIVMLSFVLSALILKRMDQIDQNVRQIMLICGLFGLFVIPSTSFGDRDHLIICGLLPFVLVQLCYLSGKDVPQYLKIPALLFGTFAVLIKPHYGLLPSALLAWRFLKTRDFKIVFHSDFLFLAFGVVLYAATLFIFFNDYVTVIFPEAIKLYASIRHPIVMPEFTAYCMILALCMFVIYESKQEASQKNVAYLLCLFSFLMLVTFVAQGKGLDYHRIPYLAFFYMALGCTTYLFMKRFVHNQISFVIAIALCFFVTLTFRGLPNPKITHEEFKELPLSVAMDKYCIDKNETCRYFFYHDTSEMIHQLAIYHNAFHASRFTSLWFSPVILINENKHSDGKSEQAEYSLEDIQAMKDKYTRMMVEDFQNMKPDVLIILSGETYDNRPFEFFDYFSYDPDFANIIDQYEKVDSLTFKREIYYPGVTTPFTGRDPETMEIYKRKNTS